MKEWRKPYRIVVFASGFRPGKRFKPTKTRGAYSEIVPCDYGFMAWNPTQHYQEARLPSAGSFLFPGIIAVRAAAMERLTSPNVRQVSIRTDQDKQVYRSFWQSDGTITGYYGHSD